MTASVDGPAVRAAHKKETDEIATPTVELLAVVGVDAVSSDGSIDTE